ncbi:MAG: aminotransferase class I/II-fold pyridoxal phosphate-dependent enzyme [Alphaproteobacteria bacterium]
MALKIAERGVVPPFIVMDVMQAAAAREAAGRHVLHLEVGQPGTPAPAPVREAAKRALDDDRLGYTLALGIDPLRARIARFYGELYGVDLDPARVVVTVGSSGAFLLAFLAAFDAGDRVALGYPAYPAYRHILKTLGHRVVGLETGAESRFQPNPAMLDAAARDGAIDGLVVASPSNPAGAMLDRPALAALVDWCAAHGTRLISDEIYHGIAYGTPATTALALTDDAIVVNSFSKYFSMTGWRLGWMVVPAAMVRAVECLTQNLNIAPPTLPQLAAPVVFDHLDLCDALVAGYARNRRILLDGLPGAGFARLAPADGAFYIYADVGHVTDDSLGFCARVLDEAGVAIAPGVDFDPLRGHRFVRMSFAGPTADIEQAVQRLAAWGGAR